MVPEMLMSFAGTLETLKQETLARMHGGAHGLAGEEALPPDVVDRAAIEAERNFALLMRERDRTLLHGIQEAIARLEKGEYGLCEECGEKISPARLKAKPMATLCIGCQAAREEEERPAHGAASGFFQA